MPGLRAPHVITVLMSGERNAQEATEYLFSLGHENVHHVAGPVSLVAKRESASPGGAVRSVRGLPMRWRRCTATGRPSLATRRAATWREIRASPVCFAANDDMAIGVIRAMTEAGRSVPGDVSVIGYDDVPTAAYVTPSLTTVRYPLKTEASVGVAALVDDRRRHARRRGTPPANCDRAIHTLAAG